MPKRGWGDDKSVTIPEKKISRRELQQDGLGLDTTHRRPKTRGECRNATRPCPYVGCRYNLYLDVNQETGSIKFNHPDKDFDELPMTCALDIAEMGGVTLEETGLAINTTRERVRQIEIEALAALKETKWIRKKLLPFYGHGDKKTPSTKKNT